MFQRMSSVSGMAVDPAPGTPRCDTAAESWSYRSFCESLGPGNAARSHPTRQVLSDTATAHGGHPMGSPRGLGT